MHAVSQKRKQKFEHRQSSQQLHRGLANGDLSVSTDDTPWYAEKLDERREAFAAAKNTKGLTLFHMFAIISFLGVAFMVVSIFVGVPGLLEIGVTAFLVSLFCLIFVRCDGKKVPPKEVVEEGHSMEDIVIETHANEKKSESPISEEEAFALEVAHAVKVTSYLVRSNPQRIPSPCRGYEHKNFSPIIEMSEPSSLASRASSSFHPRSSFNNPSKLAKSGTESSLAKSSRGGGPGDTSPIDEGNEDWAQSNSNSFDTEEDNSVAADASVMTVMERRNYGSCNQLISEDSLDNGGQGELEDDYGGVASARLLGEDDDDLWPMDGMAKYEDQGREISIDSGLATFQDKVLE